MLLLNFFSMFLKDLEYICVIYTFFYTFLDKQGTSRSRQKGYYEEAS